MNNKLLLSALLSILSGCATQNASPPLMVGTGAGSAGSGYDSFNKKSASVYSADQTKSAVMANVTDKSIVATPKDYDAMPTVYNAMPKSYDSSSKGYDSMLKSHTLKKTIPELEAENVNSARSLKRYSNSSNKNIRSGVPASSAGNPSNYMISGENYKVLPFSNGFVERGVASWYGPDFHGEKTSNGETYNMYGMTAAHKRLPIPSYVRVTNLKNKRSVVLRINDRGPFYSDRVIDLSYAAAQKLDIHQPGTEMVQIEAIKTSSKESVYLQLGVFSDPDNAKMLQKKVAKNNMPMPMVKEVQVNGKLAYRVQLGPVFSHDKVNELNAKLAKMGISETWYVTENKIN